MEVMRASHTHHAPHVGRPQRAPVQRAMKVIRAPVGARAVAIIDDILDLATIDAGALELKLAPVDVREVIDAAVLGVEERPVVTQFDVVFDDGVDVSHC